MTSRNSISYHSTARVPAPDELVSTKVHPTPDIPCHTIPSDESRRQRRKSVTFSLVTQVVSVNQTPSTSSTPASRYTKSMFGDSTNASQNVNGPTANKQQANGRPPLDNPPPSRKRRFSVVSPPQVQLHIPSSSNEVAATDEDDSPSPSSPRKRRLSALPPYEDVASPPKPGVRDLPRPNSPRHGHISILSPPANQPPPEICEEVNHRIRTTFDQPSFDFSQHVSHRTYVVRSISFSPTEECVSMLDVGVDALFPSVFPPPPICADDNFAIHPSPGKGLGMFSRRLVRSGEVVLVERPVILTPYVVGLAVPLAQLYSDMFEKLSPDVSKQLMELSSFASDNVKRNKVELKTKDVCESVMRMNALAVQLQVPKGEYAELSTHRGVFLNTSRCNHSCAPNAKWDWDRDTYSLVLTAVRAIKPGEEITIAYVSPHLPSHERQSKLRALHSFQCLCTICTQPAEALRRSDLAREKLATFWERNDARGVPSFKEWCDNRDGVFGDRMLLDLHLWAVKTIEDEGMEILDCSSSSSSSASLITGTSSSSSSSSTCSLFEVSSKTSHPWRDLGRHIDAITMSYGALGDVDNFKEWVVRAADARELERPEQRLAFKKWVSNPMAFPAWGCRKRVENRGRDSQGHGI
ncbi:hypothetical protein M413DRAFT_273919 [Hebeloma cylindrosporum]|uniref:SET domain-containing protein n=1 Tax=Hebeloma cylindrosporum TaxID=76867 RepID=A0A0C3BL00_HEBCY|nr:hypothetical protein M413DRAFT_273919 [Hebeloma cylindrosporum h7]